MKTQGMKPRQATIHLLKTAELRFISGGANEEGSGVNEEGSGLNSGLLQ